MNRTRRCKPIGIRNKKMYVKRLFYDDHSDPLDFEKCIERPTWEDTERVINKLDGKNTTQICMDDGDEDNYFCIGGGNDGLCNVFVSENYNEIIYTLINSDFRSSVMHKLVTGGQAGDFEDKICVTLELANTAAKRYYESGQLHDEYVWE